MLRNVVIYALRNYRHPDSLMLSAKLRKGGSDTYERLQRSGA